MKEPGAVETSDKEGVEKKDAKEPEEDETDDRDEVPADQEATLSESNQAKKPNMRSRQWSKENLCVSDLQVFHFFYFYRQQYLYHSNVIFIKVKPTINKKNFYQ